MPLAILVSLIKEAAGEIDALNPTRRIEKNRPQMVNLIYSQGSRTNYRKTSEEKAREITEYHLLSTPSNRGSGSRSGSGVVPHPSFRLTVARKISEIIPKTIELKEHEYGKQLVSPDANFLTVLEHAVIRLSRK